MDMDSLSHDETCTTFGLTPQILDALIAGGQILCHVHNGESRIPLAQLESFFHGGLLRVYRAQATAETLVTSLESARIPEPAPQSDLIPPLPPDAEVVDDDPI